MHGMLQRHPVALVLDEQLGELHELEVIDIRLIGHFEQGTQLAKSLPVKILLSRTSCGGVRSTGATSGLGTSNNAAPMPDVSIAAATPDQIEQVRHRLTGLVQDIRSKVHPLDFADDQLPGAAFFTERIHAQDFAFQGDRTFRHALGLDGI